MRIAESQGAVSLGLRAAASMAELYQRTSRDSDAVELLDYWLAKLPERDVSHSDAYELREMLTADGTQS